MKIAQFRSNVFRRPQAEKTIKKEDFHGGIAKRESLDQRIVPKIIEFIDAMPLTAVGKVDKKALRQNLSG